MGFFSRLGRMIRSNVNALLEAAENPEKTMEQLIKDAEDHYRETKDKVAQTMVEERRIFKKLQEQREEAAAWKRKAEFAVKKGDDGLAKEALVRAKASLELAVSLEKQQDHWAKQVEALKGGLTTMEGKIEEMKRQKKLLLTKKHIAETKMAMSTTTTEAKETDAFAEFERIANKIEDMELKSGVMLELAGPEPAAADVKLLEGTSEVDSELAKLKAELGVEEKKG